MEYHYTYLLKCDQTGQLYIGVRTSKIDPAADPYMSSSRVIKKMRSDGYTFTKTILKTFTTRAEAVQSEIELHAEFDVAKSSNFLNRGKQTSVGFDTAGTRWTSPAISQAMQGNTNSTGQRSLQAKANISRGLIGNTHTKGKILKSRGSIKPRCSCVVCKIEMDVGNMARWHYKTHSNILNTERN
jgi:hypothetical protein